MNDFMLRELIRQEGLSGTEAMKMFFALKIAIKNKERLTKH